MVSECLGAWLNYLQTLNNLCASGYRLAQSISSLESGSVHDVQGPSNQISYQIILAWDELAKGTNRATGTAKTHIVSILQDFVTQDHDQKAKDHNQMVIQESFQTLVNLQYQFSIASCEFFAQPCYFFVEQASQLSAQEMRSQTPSPAPPKHERLDSCSTQSSDHGNLEQGPSPVQQLSHLDNIRGPLPPPGHLVTMKTPFYRGSRSPLNFPLFPSNCQRRWSETAAVQSAASGEDAESQARRWSMPWENKSDKQTNRIHVPKLAGSINKSVGGSTTDSSVDGLTEAIQLLSCKPVQKSNQFQNCLGIPFIEESQPTPHQGMYGMWQSTRFQQMSFLKQMKDNKMSFDENIPP